MREKSGGKVWGKEKGRREREKGENQPAKSSDSNVDSKSVPLSFFKASKERETDRQETGTEDSKEVLLFFLLLDDLLGITKDGNSFLGWKGVKSNVFKPCLG